MKKLTALLFPAVLMSGLCVSCGTDTGDVFDTAMYNSETDSLGKKENTEPVEISFSWWGNDTRTKYTLNAIEKFEELHPDIKVNCSYSEWSGYQSRNDVQMEANTESDVMQINYAWIERYSHNGDRYYDLNTLSNYIDLSNFTEEQINFGMQNGKLNALPIALNTMTVYFNKSIFEQYGLDIPSKWDDLFTAAKVMNGQNYPLSMTAKTAFFYCESYAGQQTGKNFIDNSGNLLFNKDDIKIMIDFYCRMVNEKVTSQVEYFDKINLNSGEYAGTIAWLSDGMEYFKGAVNNDYIIKIADYTTFDGNLTNWYVKPATMYAISKNTENPEASAVLVDYLLNSTEMAEFQGIEKGIPLSRNARSYLEKHKKLSGLQYDAFTKMTENQDKLETISPYFENDDVINEFIIGCDDVIYDKATPDEAAQMLYEKFSEYISAAVKK